jgi:1-acyl-sn-glycerol-3-phosphate acyltransferase
MGSQSFGDAMFAVPGGEAPPAAEDPTPDAIAARSAAAPWVGSRCDVLTRPLPFAGFVDRLVQRSVAFFAAKQVRAIHGLENLKAAPQPFIVAINHSIKREALLIPSLLVIHSDGRWIRFLADWNFLMIPVVGWVMRRSGVIVITRKPAKPAFLNRLKPYFEEPTSPAERVKARLASGECVGVFPEGTVNRDPRRLLVGRVGMSRLSIEAGVPIVPVGVRFPEANCDELLPEDAVMEMHIGPHLNPPRVPPGQPIAIRMARTWHATVMREISRLSGKAWGAAGMEDHRGGA